MKNLWQASNQSWQASGPFACDSEKIYLMASANLLKIFTSTSTEEHILDEDLTKIIDITYLQLEEKLFFITSTSMISYVILEKNLVNEGEMTCQIISAKWSPNQERLALFLENNSIILQNQDLEIVKIIKVAGNEVIGCLAWRNDSKFFQLCCKGEKGFKVVGFTGNGEDIDAKVVSDVEGPVQSVYDKEDLLDACVISWHSALIAGVKDGKVVFWEKNGLKHGEMKVLGKEIYTIDWSCDGKLLAVGTDLGIEFYTRSNYHWYLKNLIKNAKKVVWDENFVVVGGENIEKIVFKSKYDYCNDTVAVVDGLNLKVTYFHKGVLPPPMSHCTFQMPSPISTIFLSENTFFAVSDKVYIYPSGEAIYNAPVDQIYSINSQVFVSIQEKLFILQDHSLEILEEYSSPIKNFTSDGQDIYVQITTGEVFNKQKRICTVPGLFQTMFIIKINGESKVIGLVGTNLYINEKVFCPGCTSVLVDSDFLFFTKRNAPFDILFTFPNSVLPWNSTLPEPSPDHFYSRSIEKTSTIVCLSGSSIILQHSRGNLETISPRLFMLHKVRSLILAKEYFQSFKLLRQHKIDLNLLCDVDLQGFDSKLFASQIKKQEFINLFLTSLKDSDCASRFFHTSPIDATGKSNRISDEIRNELDPDTQPLSILTSFVTKSPAEVESALRWVQELKRKTSAKPLKPPHEIESTTETKVYAEDAIKYLSWLVNPDKLYNVALSMYDLELTSQLAKYTQKDPKEYLPYLQGLSEKSEVLMKFQINFDLKNYSKALSALVEGGEEYRELCIDLIKSQKLFLQAMELLQGQDILKAIAEALVKLDHPLQAAAMFECCHEYETAKDLYLRCEEWELACKMADLLGCDIRENISNRCAELGRFENAAGVFKDINDEHQLIKFWVQAGKYKQAVIATKTEEGKKLLQSTLKIYAGAMVEDIEKNLKTWKDKKNRLQMVQQNKKLAPESSNIMNDETASLYSLDSSTSRATQFTKKQRKKAKKIRKASAKEGSQYEEDYLVDLLVTLRPDVTHLEKVEQLCMGLIFVGDFITAHLLWNKTEELKKATYEPVATLRQEEFIKKFFEIFPEITQAEEHESRLLDMFAKSTFLADGLASHKLPIFTSKLQTFFKALSNN